MPVCKSMKQLKDAMLGKMKQATDDAIDKSLEDLQENMEQFYTIPEGRYKRTGQLKDSPKVDYVRQAGNHVTGQFGVNTEKRYNPSGISTEEIYQLAESGELLGIGGFWKRTMVKVQENIREAFGKRFQG